MRQTEHGCWGRGAVVALGIGVLSSASACAPRPTSGPAPALTSALVFQGVTVVDVTTGRLRPGQTVVVRGSRIQAVGPTRRVRVPAGAQVVDAREQYLIPGLWDMHVHSYCHWRTSHPLFLAHGVTGVREANTGFIDSLLWARRAIAAGRWAGPRQLIAGPSFRGEPSPPNKCNLTNDPARHPEVYATTPAAARRLVDSIRALGADFIKTRLGHPGGGWGSAALAAERAVYVAIAAEARQVGLPFEGHVPHGELSLAEAAARGQRLFDHEIGFGYCYPVDRSDSLYDSVSLGRCRWLARQLRQHGAWLVPTLAVTAISVWDPDRIPGEALRLVREAHVPLLAGTDRDDFGTALLMELAIYVREGLTPLEALQTATLNPARAYHMTDSLGTVAPGKLADLVLLDANPLTDIHHLDLIRAVVANGRYFDRAALDRLLADGDTSHAGP